MGFRSRWRDFAAFLCAANLAKDALKSSASMSASIFLSAYTEFKSHLVQTNNPINIPIAGPLIADFDGDGIGDALIVAGFDGNQKRSAAVGFLKYYDPADSARLDRKAEQSVDNNSGNTEPTYLSPDGKYSFDEAENVVPVKLAAGEINNGDGILPVVAAVWSNGSISLHSGVKSENLKLLWRAELQSYFDIGEVHVTADLVEFHELALIVVHQMRNGDDDQGMIIVGCKQSLQYDLDIESANPSLSKPGIFSYYAFGGVSGDLKWKHDGAEYDKVLSREDDRERKYQDMRDLSTYAHHYKLLQIEIDHQSGEDSLLDAENCLHQFRASTLQTLPHFWSSEEDTTLTLAYFERNKKGHKMMHSRNDKGIAVQHPNVVVSHTQRGIGVIALSSGKPVCHLSLIEGNYYDDIQQDGIIDHFQITKERGETYGNIHWTKQLLESFQASAITTENLKRSDSPKLPPCQVLALSGIPAREHLFTRSLCNKKNSGLNLYDEDSLSRETRRVGNLGRTITHAPPLVVNGATAGDIDVIFAVNTGVVTRLNSDGKYKFQVDGMPTWGIHASSPTIGQVSIQGISPMHQPLFISSDEGATVISSTGRTLGRVTYPQPALVKPNLVDFDKDGTTDIMVVTPDGIWLYQIQLDSGGNYFVFLNGALFLAIMISILINRSTGNNRRSTDSGTLTYYINGKE